MEDFTKEDVVNIVKDTLKQDSFTMGTPGKGGAIKCYFDLSTMTDDQALSLCKRAKGLAIALGVELK